MSKTALLIIILCSAFGSFAQEKIVPQENIEHHWIPKAEKDSLAKWIWTTYEGEDSTLMLCDSKFGFVILSEREKGWSLYNLFDEEFYIRMYDEHIDSSDFTGDGFSELILWFKHGDGHGYEYSAWSAEQHYFLILDTANRTLLANTISSAEYVDYTFFEVDTALTESEEEYEEMREERSASGWSSEIIIESTCFSVSNFVPMAGTEDVRECLKEGRYCYKNGFFVKQE
jgi:hypothetical protein